MKPWQVTLESIILLVLWLVNVLGDIFTCYIILGVIHPLGGWVMLIILGSWHFILNAWVVRVQWRTMNKIAVVFLFLTQLAPLFMLCRKAWRSLVPCCARDSRTKKRKALIAKYSLCCQSWSSSTKKPPTDTDGLQKGSCIPSELLPEAHHISTTVPDAEADDDTTRDSAIDQFFTTNEHETQQLIPMGSTKFAENTYNIEMNFNPSEELYTGEPNIMKYLMNVLQMLYMEEKKLSYHIVTNSQNVILYVTKSDRHIRNLPSPMMPGYPLIVCNDIHYAYNLTKSVGYEVFAVTKRTLEENNFLVETDLSKFLWCLVWPSAIIKMYTILHASASFLGQFRLLLLISPAISVITWLVTQRGTTEPWRNTAILILLRITMTVPRAILVVGVSLSSVLKGAFCFISVKTIGIIGLAAHITYSKKWKNIELYRDEIDKYNFNPNLQPVIQICESVIYMSWAIWWYAATPKSELEKRNIEQYPLICLLTTLLGHVFGLTWLYFARSLLKKPLKDPVSVLRQIHSLEYIKT